MSELLYLLPEAFLLVTILGVILGEVGHHGERVRLLTPTALGGLCIALIQALLSYRFEPTQFLSGTLSMDGFSLFFKLCFIVLGALTVGSAHYSREVGRERRAEFFALVLGAVLTMCLAVAAIDVLLIFLCFQGASIFQYLLAAFSKRSARSAEAGVKFLIFSGVSGVLFLFGAALLFAHAHTLNLFEIHKALQASPPAAHALTSACVLIFLGLGMQMAVFPMHWWAPDALEGAPTPASGFLSAGLKAMGVAVAVRFFIGVFGEPFSGPGKWQTLSGVAWPQLLAVSAAITMISGALLSFRQNHFKRLLGCLALSQGGFYLMGLVVLDEVGIAAILYSWTVDLFALSGAYYVLAYFHDRLGAERLGDLGGAIRSAVPESVALILCLISIAGVPPAPGFIGKFALIGAALRRDWNALALTAIVATCFAGVAAARLTFGLIGSGTDRTAPLLEGVESGRRVFLAAIVGPMLLLGIFADAVLRWAGQSLQFIFW